MRWRAACLCFVAAGACGDNGAGPRPIVGVTDGTRLRATALSSGDARIFTGWFDTVEKVPCRFSATVDGSYRCLPTSQVSLDSGLFADDRCTESLVATTPEEADATFVVAHALVDGCPLADAVRVFELGEVRDDPGFHVVDGTCSPLATTDGLVMHALGPEVDASRFVAADLVVEDGEERIQPYAFHAEDGAREVTGGWDRERDAEASPVTAVQGWAPTEIVLGDYYSDAACSVPAGVDIYDSRACAPPTAAISFLDQETRYFAVGPALSSTVAFSNSSGTCQGGPIADGDRMYEVGDEISASTFEAMSVLHDGSGRIQTTRFSDGSGRDLLPPFELFDSATGEPCGVTRFADGSLRCVTSNQTAFLYAREDCTGEDLIAQYDPARAPAVLVVTAPPPDAFSETILKAAFTRGPDFSGDVFSNGGDGVCRPYPRMPGLAYADLGESIELPRIIEEE